MSALYECPANHLPQVGTLSYYGYRHLNESQQKALYALDQIRWQWIQASELYYEPSVGTQKLLWWQQQIAQIVEGTCQAPQLKTLLGALPATTLQSKLSDDINYTLEQLNGTAQSDFITHCQHSYLGIAVLQALILNPKTNPSAIKSLNTSNEILRHIYLMGKHYSRQIIFDHQIQPYMNTDEYHTLAKKWLFDAKKHATLARKDADKYCCALYRYNKIHFKSTQKLIKAIDSPFTQSIEISPLAMLWYSLRPMKIR